MSRYATTQVLKKSNGPRYLTTTIVPVIPYGADDVYIVTTSIERLDKLADKFYGDASKWWVIATANGIGKGTLVIPTDSRLRIPSINNLQQIINNANSLR